VSFLHTWIDVFQDINNINLYVLLIATATLIAALISKMLMPKLPNLLIGMVVGSVLAIFLINYTDSIKLVGEIPAHLPPMS